MIGTFLVIGLVLPLFSFVLNHFFGAANRPGVKVMGPVAILAAFVCFAIAAIANGGGAVDFFVYRWLDPAGAAASGGIPQVDVDLYLDPLSAVMTLVITGVGFLIHAYAAAYMDDEGDFDYARFFAHMNLFVFSMLLLVLAHNFVVLVVGWAMVGLCSYLLIGFYHRRPSAVLAARKAFVMNVIGDVGLVIASFIAFVTVGSLAFGDLFSHAGSIDRGTLEAIGLFLLAGAVAKSAQVPLHTWLPDAMEGPTPVSALIHAATMVTAGVYLVARFHPVYGDAPVAAGTAATIGVVTALMAALVACVQSDIKRVLAYSTMSQVGYMFFAVAAGAEVAGIFHLVTHAFFKALLFLAAGNVIHALGGEQDMRRMGGLWNQMPVTRWLFLVGVLALAGVPPLAGFFSKDEIVGAGLVAGPAHPLYGLVLMAVSGLTAYYMFRAFLVTFMGTAQLPERHAHEAHGAFIWPLMILAVLAAFGGLVQPLGAWHLLSDYMAPVMQNVETPGAVVALALGGSLTLVLVGMFAAYAVFAPAPQVRAARSQPRVLARGFFWDRAYDAVVVRPLWALGAALDGLVEGPVVVGAADSAARLSALMGQQVRRLQTGYLRSYAMVFAAAALVVVVVVGVAAR